MASGGGGGACSRSDGGGGGKGSSGSAGGSAAVRRRGGALRSGWHTAGWAEGSEGSNGVSANAGMPGCGVAHAGMTWQRACKAVWPSRSHQRRRRAKAQQGRPHCSCLTLASRPRNSCKGAESCRSHTGGRAGLHSSMGCRALAARGRRRLPAACAPGLARRRPTASSPALAPNAGGFDVALANFGSPRYGGTLRARLIYVDPAYGHTNTCGGGSCVYGCSDFAVRGPAVSGCAIAR